jgi:hypothetical protein
VNLYKILDKEVCHLIENMKLYVIEAYEIMFFVTKDFDGASVAQSSEQAPFTSEMVGSILISDQ